MYVNATIQRMVRRIGAVPVELRDSQLKSLQRYSKRHHNRIDESLSQLIEAGDIDALMQWLFETPREVFQPVSGRVTRIELPASEIELEESDSIAESQTSAGVETQNPPSDQATEPNLSETTDTEVESAVLESDTEEAESTTQPADVPELPEAPKSSESGEPSEPEWGERLRTKLLKMLSRQRKERSKKRTSTEGSSRWEFWHTNSGLLKLTDWLQSEGVQSVASSLSVTIDALASHNIHNVADLLLRPPVRYEKVPFTPIEPNMNLGFNTIRGKIAKRYVEVASPMKRWVVVLEGKADTFMVCTWTGKVPRGWNKWTVGNNVGFVGDVVLDEYLEMKNPEPVGVDGRGSGILSQYDFEGIPDVDVRDLLASILMTVLSDVQDSLPKEVLEQSDVLPLGDALREAHFPANQNFKGHARLAFEEIFLYHIGKRLNSKFSATDGIANKICHHGLAQLSWMRNIVLSDEQEVVLSEIRREMLQSRPMRRLIQGDVGTGKPMVAMFAALSLFGQHAKSPKGNGRSNQKKPLVVYLCDDELSAERRFVFMEESFKQLGIQCKLMTQKPNKADFNILETDGGIVVVTQEVLQTKLQALTNIRLVIVEENQRVGENIPYGFLKRSPSPDLLVFTPTPQPIHVLETIYADFALSTIQLTDVQLPSCAWNLAKERTVAYTRMLELVQQGRQGLIVWPMVDGKDLMDIQQALQAAGAIQNHFLPGVRIGIYCSAMSKQERMKVFEEFKHKRIDVLLCTTVIEDTPSVENTTMIIVEKAELSNAVRLHRLRGHLVKSHYASYCHYIVSEDATEEQLNLVDLVCHETDGLALAEKVADTSNELSLRWANKDVLDLRLQARNLAHQLSLRDLKRCRWPLLNNAVRYWWTDFSIPDQRVKNQRHRYKKKRRR